jgi:hypothetical protein
MMNSWFRKKKAEVKPREQTAWPSFVNDNRAIARWTRPDGKARVYLVARSDGAFDMSTEIWSDDDYELCWIPEGTGGSFYDSEERAIREIHAAYAWSRDVQREDNTGEQSA